MMRSLPPNPRDGRSTSLTKQDFPLPTVAKRLAIARDFLEDGKGIYQLRGLRVEGRSKDDLRLLYWGLGLHLGTAVSQSKDGDILGDVRNVGVDIHSPQGRGYKSNQRLNFHTNSADVVGLFVLRTAMQGGQSKVVSSVSAHNEIARLRPDLLEVLYHPFYWSWNQQEPAGAPPYYQQPIFTLHEGKFSCRYIRGHINNAQRFPEVPRLTAEQIAALDLLDQVTNDESLHVAYDFRPGDVQLLNNHICLHARSAFEDYPEHDRRRHLLRMWLSVPNSRALSPALGTIYQDQRSGAVRGGFPSRTGRIIYRIDRRVGRLTRKFRCRVRYDDQTIGDTSNGNYRGSSWAVSARCFARPGFRRNPIQANRSR